MRNKILPWALLVIAFAGIIYYLVHEPKSDATIRIGWQTSWATQGQLAEVLMKTNITDLNDIKADFHSFTYGAPLSEAALAGQLDVAFVGDQPAITLLSNSTDWKVVARLMNFRVGIVVPFNSAIRSVADLKGKTLAIPFGSSAHRIALLMIKEAGLDSSKDVKILNIPISQQNEIIKAGQDGNWKGIDAFASWDHNIANFENNHWAKLIASRTALGVVMMSAKYMNENPESAARFLQSFKLAYYYYAHNEDQADKWFASDAPGAFDLKLLSQVAQIEPNIQAKELRDVDVSITDSARKTLQRAADFALSDKLITSGVNLSVDRSIVNPDEGQYPPKNILISDIKAKK